MFCYQWDVHNQRSVSTFTGHEHVVYSVAWSPLVSNCFASASGMSMDCANVLFVHCLQWIVRAHCYLLMSYLCIVFNGLFKLTVIFYCLICALSSMDCSSSLLSSNVLFVHCLQWIVRTDCYLLMSYLLINYNFSLVKHGKQQVFFIRSYNIQYKTKQSTSIRYNE